MLSDHERRALEAIDLPAAVTLLSEMVRIPSVTGADAESDLQHRCAEELRSLDLEVDAWKIDLMAMHADVRFPGAEAARDEAYGVVATSSGEGQPALVLQGHVDVVPTGDIAKWQGLDPWSARIEGDVLHGRGACDMKAGVVANIATVRALRAAGIELDRPLAVHCVVSEEDGGLGAFATMLRGHGGECAVITEPTDGRVVVANAGALTFRLRVHGRAAHGSMRHAGVSAIEAFVPALAALRGLEARRNLDPPELFAGNTCPYPISVGTVHAGDWASSVPDLLVAEGRLGVQLEEDPSDARRALEAALHEASAADPWLRDHPLEVEWSGGQFASGRLPEGHWLLEDVQGAVADVTGRLPSPAAAPYGSDLRLYAGMGGIPTLHYGPGSAQFAHAPREQVAISDVVDTTRALVVLAMRRCGAR